MNTPVRRDAAKEAELDAKIRRIQEANRKREARRKEVELDRMSERAAGSDAARVSVYVRPRAREGRNRRSRPANDELSNEHSPTPAPINSSPREDHKSAATTTNNNNNKAVDDRTPPQSGGRRKKHESGGWCSSQQEYSPTDWASYPVPGDSPPTSPPGTSPLAPTSQRDHTVRAGVNGSVRTGSGECGDDTVQCTHHKSTIQSPAATATAGLACSSGQSEFTLTVANVAVTDSESDSSSDSPVRITQNQPESSPAVVLAADIVRSELMDRVVARVGTIPHLSAHRGNNNDDSDDDGCIKLSELALSTAISDDCSGYDGTQTMVFTKSGWCDLPPSSSAVGESSSFLPASMTRPSLQPSTPMTRSDQSSFHPSPGNGVNPASLDSAVSASSTCAERLSPITALLSQRGTLDMSRQSAVEAPLQSMGERHGQSAVETPLQRTGERHGQSTVDMNFRPIQRPNQPLSDGDHMQGDGAVHYGQCESYHHQLDNNQPIPQRPLVRGGEVHAGYVPTDQEISDIVNSTTNVAGVCTLQDYSCGPGGHPGGTTVAGSSQRPRMLVARSQDLAADSRYPSSLRQFPGHVDVRTPLLYPPGADSYSDASGFPFDERLVMGQQIPPMMMVQHVSGQHPYNPSDWSSIPPPNTNYYHEQSFHPADHPLTQHPASSYHHHHHPVCTPSPPGELGCVGFPVDALPNQRFGGPGGYYPPPRESPGWWQQPHHHLPPPVRPENVYTAPPLSLVPPCQPSIPPVESCDPAVTSGRPLVAANACRTTAVTNTRPQTGGRALVARRDHPPGSTLPPPTSPPRSTTEESELHSEIQCVTFVDGKRVETSITNDKMLSKNRDVRLGGV